MGRRREQEHVVSRFDRKIEFIDSAAREEGPRRKHWSLHDMKSIRPLTDNQYEAIRAYAEGDNVGLLGSVGTGKTFIAIYLAAGSLVSDPNIHRIIVVRSAAGARDVGFLPGTLEEKGEPLEEAISEAIGDLFAREKTYEDMKEAKVLQFRLTTYLRGLSWDNAVVVVEEAQNMTFHELFTVFTRIGKNSRIIITGDTRQVDLTGRPHDTSGLAEITEVLRDMNSVSLIEFTRHDIVRSAFVKSFVAACEDRAARFA